MSLKETFFQKHKKKLTPHRWHPHLVNSSFLKFVEACNPSNIDRRSPLMPWKLKTAVYSNTFCHVLIFSIGSLQQKTVLTDSLVMELSNNVLWKGNREACTGETWNRTRKHRKHERFTQRQHCDVYF